MKTKDSNPQKYYLLNNTCPRCSGKILKYILSANIFHETWRWTCRDCQADYGYNTEKPLIEGRRSYA